MHVADFATDKCFVGIDFARKLDSRVVMQGGADAMKHKPRRLLGDAEAPGQLAGVNAVLAVADNPVSAHPLVESDRGILEDRSHFEAELLFASATEPDATSLDERVLLRAATGAGRNTIREAQVERVLENTVIVREVDDCFL